jgi:hypothetical protein
MEFAIDFREPEREDSRDPEADDEQDNHIYAPSVLAHLRDPVKVPLVTVKRDREHRLLCDGANG